MFETVYEKIKGREDLQEIFSCLTEHEQVFYMLYDQTVRVIKRSGGSDLWVKDIVDCVNSEYDILPFLIPIAQKGLNANGEHVKELCKAILEVNSAIKKYYRTNDDTAICPDCDGDGNYAGYTYWEDANEEDICILCQGKGKVDTWEAVFYDTKDYLEKIVNMNERLLIEEIIDYANNFDKIDISDNAAYRTQVKPVAYVIGKDGNTFSVLSSVCQALKRADQWHLIDEVKQRVFKAKSYTDALCIMQEYVEMR